MSNAEKKLVRSLMREQARSLDKCAKALLTTESERELYKRDAKLLRRAAREFN